MTVSELAQACPNHITIAVYDTMQGERFKGEEARIIGDDDLALDDLEVVDFCAATIDDEIEACRKYPAHDCQKSELDCLIQLLENADWHGNDIVIVAYCVELES